MRVRSIGVRNLVLTAFGGAPFDPTIGSDVADILFENVSPFTAGLVASKIRETIASFEPRVRVTKVEVNPDVDNNAYEVTIIYDIRGLARSGQVLNFALESAANVSYQIYKSGLYPDKNRD